MKFLVDNSLSPRLAQWMRQHSLDVIHVRDIGLGSAPDADIFEYARRHGRILISGDTDFGALSVAWRASLPSLILFRGKSNRRPERQLTLLLATLPKMESDLEEGCIVVIRDRTIRIRTRPRTPNR